MTSMINALKQKMLQEQMAPPTQQQLGMQDALAQYHLQSAQSANPMNNFLLHAGTSLMSAPQGEDSLASFGHALQKGTAGMQQGVAEMEGHMEKAISLKKAMSDTYNFVEKFMYIRKQHEDEQAIKKEMLGLQRKKIDVSERLMSQKMHHVLTKDIKKKYDEGLSEDQSLLEDLKGMKERLNKLGDFGVVGGKVAQFSPMLGGAIGVGEQKDITNLIHDLENYVIKSAKKAGGNRLTNKILDQIKASKLNLGMGKEAIEEIINKLMTATELDVKGKKFVKDAIERGYDEHQAKDAYNMFLTLPAAKSPWEVMEDLSSIKQ